MRWFGQNLASSRRLFKTSFTAAFTLMFLKGALAEEESILDTATVLS